MAFPDSFVLFHSLFVPFSDPFSGSSPTRAPRSSAGVRFPSASSPPPSVAVYFPPATSPPPLAGMRSLTASSPPPLVAIRLATIETRPPSAPRHTALRGGSAVPPSLPAPVGQPCHARLFVEAPGGAVLRILHGEAQRLQPAAYLVAQSPVFVRLSLGS